MKQVKVKTAVQMRDELNKERNDFAGMPATVIIEGNRHAIKHVQTIAPGTDPGKTKGEFQIVAGDGIGE
jgi:hypothetical protein